MTLETYGKGYGGDVGLMVGIDIEQEKILAVGVTTHAETPGMGALAKTDASFGAQYSGLGIADPIKVTQDGGQISALSGATITSRAVSNAATEAGQIFLRLKPQIEEQLKAFE